MKDLPFLARIVIEKGGPYSVRMTSLTAIIFIIIIPSICLAAANDLNIYFIPESGFLRVNTVIPIRFEQVELKLCLFPNAHITDVHLPNSSEYQFNIQRTALNTIVEISIDECDLGNQILELMYEGFLTNYTLTSKKALTQELLWYPLFSGSDQTFYPGSIKISVPADYNPTLIDGELIDSQLSTFWTFIWEYQSDEYPEIYFSGDYVIESKIKSPFDNLSFTKTRLLMDKITQFDQALTQNESTVLSEYIHPDFPNRNKFVNFLSERPGASNDITTIIDDVSASGTTAEIYSYLAEDDTPEYQVKSQWTLWDDDWFLSSLTMTPYGYDLIDLQESENSESSSLLVAWIRELKDAVSNQNLPWLDYHLVMPITEKLSIVEFLYTVREHICWDTAAVSYEANKAVLTIQEDILNTKLQLTFFFFPDQHSWKIYSAKVCPLFY